MTDLTKQTWYAQYYAAVDDDWETALWGISLGEITDECQYNATVAGRRALQGAAGGDPFTFNWRKQDGTARQAGYYYTAEKHVFPRLTRTSQLTEQMQF